MVRPLSPTPKSAPDVSDTPEPSSALDSSVASGEPTLKRAVGLWLLVFYGLGTIIGAGIYVLIGAVAGAAGMATPLSFILAGILAGLSSLSYAELSARYPEAAGATAYVKEAFGADWLSRLVGLGVVLVGLLLTASLARGAMGYLDHFVAVPELPGAIALIVLFTAIAAVGVRESLTIAAVMTLVELLGLALVVAAGMPALSHLPAALPDMLLPVPGQWVGIGAGAYLAFFAYLGFEDIVNLAEEAHAPETTVPRAVILSIVLSTVLYVLVAVVVLLAVPMDSLAGSRAPLALVVQGADWLPRGTVSAIALIAVPNGILITLIMLARILYGMARRGWLPRALGRVNARTRTPLYTTLIAGGLALVLTVLVDFAGLVALTSGVTLLVFTVVNLALAHLHRHDPHAHDKRRLHLRAPRWCPYAAAACCVALLAAEILL